SGTISWTVSGARSTQVGVAVHNDPLWDGGVAGDGGVSSDGGPSTDAGHTVPPAALAYRVGCGCSGGEGTFVLGVVVVLAQSARRARRGRGSSTRSAVTKPGATGAFPSP